MNILSGAPRKIRVHQLHRNASHTVNTTTGDIYVIISQLLTMKK